MQVGLQELERVEMQESWKVCLQVNETLLGRMIA